MVYIPKSLNNGNNGKPPYNPFIVAAIVIFLLFTVLYFVTPIL